MVVATNPRPGRVWRTLLGIQSGKGTPVADFTGAAQVWTYGAQADYVREQIDPEWWMNYHNGDFMNARYKIQTLARGEVTAHASPTLLSVALQSLFGPLGGSTFTLVGYVNAWLSMGFVEDKTLVNGALRFMRFQDTLVHRIELDVDATGYVDVTLSYASEVQDTALLSSLGGITLPAAPMDATDRVAFPGRAVTLTQGGAPIPFERLTLSLNVQLDAYWDQMGRRTRAIRRGPLKAHLIATGKPGDEYWQAALDSVANTKKPYTMTLTDPVSGHQLIVGLSNVSYNFDPFELRDEVYLPMVARDLATQDASGNFVSITLT